MIVSMAMRNALRQPRRSLLLGGAVAFGVLVICLAAGFTAGMESAVQANVTLLSGGHVVVSGFTGSASGRAQNRSSDATLAADLRAALPDAVSVTRAASAQATVVFGSREQQLKLRGVEWGEDRLYSRSLVFVMGDAAAAAAERSIVLGARSAERFGLALGDSVLARLSTASGQQNVVEYRLGAVYDDSAAGGMTTALVPFADLRSDLNLPDGSYQALVLFLVDASESDAAAERLRAALVAGGRTQADSSPGAGMKPGTTAYRIATVAELSGQTGAVLGTVKWIGAAVFAVMLVLTAAGIANTYRMILVERTREIGTLRCIGFRRSHVYRVFLVEALVIAAAGAVAGMAASFPVGALAGLARFDASGGFGTALRAGRLGFEPAAAQLALTFAAVLAMALAAVSGPARRAAALAPAQALAKTS